MHLFVLLCEYNLLWTGTKHALIFKWLLVVDMRVEKLTNRSNKTSRHLQSSRIAHTHTHTRLLTQIVRIWSSESSVQDRKKESGSDDAQSK